MHPCFTFVSVHPPFLLRLLKQFSISYFLISLFELCTNTVCHWLYLTKVIIGLNRPRVFIHSFILAISIAPLQVHYYSEALLTTARILYRSFTPKRTNNCR